MVLAKLSKLVKESQGLDKIPFHVLQTALKKDHNINFPGTIFPGKMTNVMQKYFPEVTLIPGKNTGQYFLKYKVDKILAVKKVVFDQASL